MTPLEEASLQNQKLKAAYEARMARLDPSQAMQKTSLVSKARVWVGGGGGGAGLNRSFPFQTLSLQRQVMENLVIAKAREETVSFPSILAVQRQKFHVAFS